MYLQRFFLISSAFFYEIQVHFFWIWLIVESIHTEIVWIIILLFIKDKVSVARFSSFSTRSIQTELRYLDNLYSLFINRQSHLIVRCKSNVLQCLIDLSINIMETWSGKLRFDFNGEKQYTPNKSEWTIYDCLLIHGLSCEKD